MALGSHIYCVRAHVCTRVPVVWVCTQVYVCACVCMFVQAASWREGSPLGENGSDNAMYLSQPVGCLLADPVHRATGEPGLCLSPSLTGPRLGVLAWHPWAALLLT